MGGRSSTRYLSANRYNYDEEEGAASTEESGVSRGSAPNKYGEEASNRSSKEILSLNITVFDFRCRMVTDVAIIFGDAS